ncbi:hypothetical protein [Microbulbifer taiwanensis]|uniref:Uncharacterized protein n=1 Tax=Microbulbifer taiwanensis TaxID=986746 RepID=A0ABW1YMN0_9GAMM|nr:hypothetical protein [Microbulbifer taiwanensis]
MIKFFSQLKQQEKTAFDDLYKTAVKEGPEWFCTMSFGELKRISDFASQHSWEVDLNKVKNKFTPFEFHMIESLQKTNRQQAIEQRERVVKTNTQRSTRFAEHWLSNLQTRRQIEELESKVKQKAPSDMESQWRNLQGIFE